MNQSIETNVLHLTTKHTNFSNSKTINQTCLKTMRGEETRRKWSKNHFISANNNNKITTCRPFKKSPKSRIATKPETLFGHKYHSSSYGHTLWCSSHGCLRFRLFHNNCLCGQNHSCNRSCILQSTSCNLCRINNS